MRRSSRYMEGVAEPEAIDTVMKLGMNHPMGPLELADLIGLDTCLNILEVLHRELGDDRYQTFAAACGSTSPRDGWGAKRGAASMLTIERERLTNANC